MLDWERLNAAVEILRDEYANTTVYPHLILDNLVNLSTLRHIVRGWPDNSAPWKDSQRGKRSMPLASGGTPETALMLIEHINGQRFTDYLKRITRITDLRSDPTAGGGGLHETLSGGCLPMHVDFNRQEIEGETYYRRLNVLLFLNEGWKEEWQGNLELAAHPKRKENRVSIMPVMNRMVIAESSDRSWHGHPHILCCPPTVSRKSIALYYYSRTPHESYQAYHSTEYVVNKKQLKKEKRAYEREHNK